MLLCEFSNGIHPAIFGSKRTKIELIMLNFCSVLARRAPRAPDRVSFFGHPSHGTRALLRWRKNGGCGQHAWDYIPPLPPGDILAPQLGFYPAGFWPKPARSKSGHPHTPAPKIAYRGPGLRSLSHSSRMSERRVPSFPSHWCLLRMREPVSVPLILYGTSSTSSIRSLCS